MIRSACLRIALALAATLAASGSASAWWWDRDRDDCECARRVVMPEPVYIYDRGAAPVWTANGWSNPPVAARHLPPAPRPGYYAVPAPKVIYEWRRYPYVVGPYIHVYPRPIPHW